MGQNNFLELEFVPKKKRFVSPQQNDQHSKQNTNQQLLNI